MSASSAAFVRRVSTVMILQPRALALTRDSHQPSGCAQTFVAMIMKERVFSVRHGARRRTAPGELLGLHAAGAAGGRRFVGPVHGAEMTGKTDDGRTRLLRVARIEHHAVSTVLLPDAQKIFRNHPVGFLPGAADESGILAALGIRALHRMEQTIRVVESLERREPLRAEDVAGVLLPVFNRFDHVPACMELMPHDGTWLQWSQIE